MIAVIHQNPQTGQLQVTCEGAQSPQQILDVLKAVQEMIEQQIPGKGKLIVPNPAVPMSMPQPPNGSG